MQSMVTLITGAAGGIGLELVRYFGRAGQQVVAVDRNIDALNRMAAAVALPLAPHLHCADLTQTADCQQAIASTQERFGRLDAIVHNAGITQIGPFAQADAGAVRAVLEVNLMGTIELTRWALPHLQASRGRIAVMSSVAGIAPLVDRCAYAASKHGLHGFFESLRAELHGSGVSVTMVCPSFTQTNIAAERSTTGKLLTPSQVAAATYAGTMARRRLVFPSLTARLAWYLSRLAPAWYERTMLRRIRGQVDERRS